MKHYFSTFFLLTVAFSYAQDGVASMVANLTSHTTELTIERCDSNPLPQIELRRIVIQAEYSEREMELLEKLTADDQTAMLAKGAFSDHADPDLPYLLQVNHPVAGFNVIGFSDYQRLFSHVSVVPNGTSLITICEGEFFAVLDTRNSLFTRLLSGDTINKAVSE